MAKGMREVDRQSETPAGLSTHLCGPIKNLLVGCRKLGFQIHNLLTQREVPAATTNVKTPSFSALWDSAINPCALPTAVPVHAGG